MVLITAVFLPESGGFASLMKSNRKRDNALFSGRDIIVNVNQDDKREINKSTLLSDRDSTAKGYITKEKGDRWLNNSLEFRLKKGSKTQGSGRIDTSTGERSRADEKDSGVVFRVTKSRHGQSGSDGMFTDMAIPDKNGITMKNAIFYSNSGMFSFNTAKFNNFNYFKSMKDKIASNWYPPIMANAMIGGGYNSATGGFTPGSVRIMAIPPQKVKLYFIMNRSGDIQKVEIVDSYGNKPLDDSCVDAVRMSKTFGKVPDDIKGEFILIPFIFGYYSY